MNDLYKGINPIYESMKSSIMEDQEKGTDKKAKALDTVSLVSTAMNTFFSILLNSKMENAKTVRGFQEIKNKILGTNNFGAFRQYLISVVDSLAAMDPSQKDAYQKNIQFITGLLANVEPILSDPKIFDSLKKDTVSKLVNNFEEDLKERESQMKKTNPKLFGEVVKQGLVVKEAKRTGEEDNVEDAEFRGKAFNKSKESLDASSAFVGMIDRDSYVAVIKGNEDVKRYKEIAQNLYKRSQDLQMLDRKGLRNIVTPSGEIKRGDYVRQQDSLLNDIIRQKKEYERIKEGILKQGGLTPPPPVIPVCPPGKIYDPSKGICVSSGVTGGTSGGEGDNKPKPKTSDCTFPISLNTKCAQVGDIQNKLMEVIPSIKEYLPKKGGADKVYGKGTATVSNIVWGYLSGNTGQSITSPLSKEMYDAIMALTPNDIDTTTAMMAGAAIKDSRNWEMSISDKIQEREEIKGSSILSFEDFYSVIEESYNFAKIDEDSVFDRLKKVAEPVTDVNKKVEPATTPSGKKLIDSCIKDSIAQGKVLPCVGATGGTGTTGATGSTGATGGTGGTGATGEIKWKGLKPVKDGAYTIYYDESWSEWWSDTGKGAIVAGLIVGAVALTAGAVTPILAAGSGALATAGTAVGSGILAAGGAAAGLLGGGALGTAATLTIGAIGGSAIAKWAGDDRKPATILVFNGYIESIAVKSMSRGLYNSLSGTVSSQDLLAIYSTLILSKGTYTEGPDGKAISVWEKIKKDYAAFGGEDLSYDIKDITSGDVGGFFKDVVTDMDEIPGFPTSFKTKDPTNGGPTTFESAKDACDEAVGKLNGNVTKMAENLKNITEEDLEVLSESMGELTEGVAKEAGESEE